MHRISLIQTVPRIEKSSTWLQLFFDLIYVAILIELGDQLAQHFNLAGLGFFVLVFVPVFWSWLEFVEYGSRYPVDDLGQRVLTVVYMGILLLMAFEIHALAETGGARFLFTFGVSKLVLSMVYGRAWLYYPEERARTSRRAGIYLIIGGLWMAIALLAPTVRWLWLVPILLGLLVPWLVRLSRARSDRAHPPLAESSYHFVGHRFGELTIIVLGEFFIKLVTSSAGRGIGGLSLAIGASLLAISVGLWWLYFDHLEHAALRKASLRVGPWTYAHFPFIVAITAYGVVGNKIFGAEAGAPVPDGQRLLFTLALAVALAAFAAIERLSDEKDEPLSRGPQPWVRLGGVALLLALAAFGGGLSASWLASLVAAVLVLQVGLDVHERLKRLPPAPHGAQAALTLRSRA